MKKSVQLRNDRAKKVRAQKGLIDKRKSENRAFTDEETTSFNDLDNEIRNLDDQIAQAEREEAAEARAADLEGEDQDPPAGPEGGEGKEKRKAARRYNIAKAIRQAGNGELDGLEKELHDEMAAQERGAKMERSGNLMIPDFVLRAEGQSATQDSGNFGAALIQDQAPRVQPTIYPKTVLEELGATVLRGLSGGDLPLPRMAEYQLDWVAEGVRATRQKAQVAGPRLSPKRAVGSVVVYNSLLNQTSSGVLNMIEQNLLKAESVILDKAAINGAGGVAPTGLLSNPGILLATDIDAADADWARVVELQTLVANEERYSDNMSYLTDPSLMAQLKQIKKDAGSGRFLVENRMIDGYQAKETSLVPTLSTNHVLIFGDFSQLFIGKWGAGLVLKVDASSAEANETDGVIVTINTHADTVLADPKAFAINKFLNA